MRVSGTWANSTYFHDADAPPPATPPEGFGGVLTRAQWRGVVEFAKATDAALVTSFAISAGTRDASGAWTPDQLRKLLAYTDTVGGRITAAEFFNEPNVAVIGGAPKGYDAAAYARDFGVFLPFIRKAAPDLRVLGPGSVGEGGLLANYPGIKSEAMLAATGARRGCLLLPFVQQRLEALRRRGRQRAASRTPPEAALSPDWLARTERDARHYAALRDRFEPGKPIWLTETGETGCGGNPWASTFTDTFRYVEQLGRVARLGVQVVMHNTLSASDYALIDEDTLEPRPSYWAALLWKRLMGTGCSTPAPRRRREWTSSRIAWRERPAALRSWLSTPSEAAARELALPMRGERYTLASSAGLLSHSVELNGAALALGKDGTVPVLRGAASPAGTLSLPPRASRSSHSPVLTIRLSVVIDCR